jgi:hypothetical protein
MPSVPQDILLRNAVRTLRTPAASSRMTVAASGAGPLRAARAPHAPAEGLPAGVVFADRTLIDMVRLKPRDRSDMGVRRRPGDARAGRQGVLRHGETPAILERRRRQRLEASRATNATVSSESAR